MIRYLHHEERLATYPERAKSEGGIKKRDQIHFSRLHTTYVPFAYVPYRRQQIGLPDIWGDQSGKIPTPAAAAISPSISHFLEREKIGEARFEGFQKKDFSCTAER